jgi:hypothetical protein
MMTLQIEVPDVVGAVFLSKLLGSVDVFILEERTWVVEVAVDAEEIAKIRTAIRRWARAQQLAEVVVHVAGERQIVSPCAAA